MSENEILILDFLALLGGTHFNNLTKDNYCFQINVDYTHSLNDDELVIFLDKMCEEKLVSINFKSDSAFLEKNNVCDKHYFITEYGGKQWSLERNPIWEKYCIDSSDESVINFLCIDQMVGKSFSKVALLSGLYSFSEENLSMYEISPGSIIGWKTFDH